MEDLIIKINGKEHHVKVEETDEGKLRVHLGDEVFEVETKQDIEEEILDLENKGSAGSEGNLVKAPLPGTVISINVKPGDHVKEGDCLVKLVAMKMENDVIAERNGIVNDVKVKKNDSVNSGDILITLE